MTIDGLRRKPGKARIVAVLEPRSNTMRLGVHRAELPKALAGADRVWLYQPAGLDWNLDDVARSSARKRRSRPKCRRWSPRSPRTCTPATTC